MSDGSGVPAADPLPRDDNAEIGGGPSTARNAGDQSRVRDALPSASAHPARSSLSIDSVPVSSVRSRGALKVASLNMNGAFSRAHSSLGGGLQDKWMLLNQLMRQGRIAILALQETHYTTQQAEKLNELFEGLIRVYISPDPASPTAARGVAFVVNLRVIRDGSVTTQVHIPGRAMSLSLKRRRGSRLTVLNTYAPNLMDESANFWNLLRARAGESNWIRPDVLLGDFNIVEDAADRAPARPDNSAAVQALQSLLIKLGLVDGWRSCNGDSRLFSYHQIASGSQSRIDRIYVSCGILSMSHSWDIRSAGIPTDHCLVSVAFADYNEPAKGPGRWRLPSALLTDSIFLDDAQRLGHEVLETPCPEDRNGESAQWRLHRYKVEVLAIARSRTKTLTSKWDRRLTALRKDISAILRNNSIPIEERDTEAAILRNEETRLEQRRFQACRDNLQLRDKIDGETISPYWMKANGSGAAQDPIYELQVPTQPGEPVKYTRDSAGMATVASEFYNSLQPDPDLLRTDQDAVIRDLLSGDIPVLSQAQKGAMQEPIRWGEIERALLMSAPRKAPGMDGLPAEFWLKMHKLYQTKSKKGKPAFNVISFLKDAFNSIEAVGVDPQFGFAKGWICPIYKLKGDPRQARNYRPITVLNTDYKLMTKALAARLGEVAPSLVHPDQAGFVPGRRIFDHTRLAQTMIDYAEICEDEGALVALDQEKAYDRINHHYLWAVLRRMGFPESFILTIRRLYEKAESLVLVNGMFSPLFAIIRGVRQGDPVSCILFDLAIEPLAIALRAAPLRGFLIPGVRERILTAFFADDTTVYLSARDDYGVMLGILRQWCAASRARFNVDKTELLPIGPKVFRDRVLASRSLDNGVTIIPLDVRIVPDGAAIRLLGAWVGNNISQKEVWAPMLRKIEENLLRWNRRKPTLKGKRLVVGLEVQSRTQYLTRVQGMPKAVEATLTTMIRKFLWGETVRSPPVAMKTLADSLKRGGIGLLDIESRNEAVEIMWVKDYLMLSVARPRWAYVADVLLAKAVTADSRSFERDARINAFLQSWRVSLSSVVRLPEYLRSMIRIARKFNVRFDALDPSDEIKDSLPFWRHFALQDDTRHATSKSVRCLMTSHNVLQVGQACRVVTKLYDIGRPSAHRPSDRCQCADCAFDRAAGCDNPHRCAMAARKMLEKLCPRWAAGPTRVADGLSLTVRRKHKNAENELANRRVLFDPSILARMPLANHFRVFESNDNRDSTVIRRPPRGIAVLDEEVEVYTDGSCDNNGAANATAAGGVWFGPNSDRNMSSLVPGEVHSNQVAELFAVSMATVAVPPFAPLHIVTDSKYVMKGLTAHVGNWEECGWFHVANSAAIRDVLSRLRARSAPTTFRWVKGHSGDPGNEGADMLAKDAVRMRKRMVMPPAPLKFVASGATLATVTQKLAYGMVKRSRDPDCRNTTRKNLDKAAEAIHDLTGVRPTDSAIWCGIWKLDVDRPVRAFWWKMMHGAHRLGAYWYNIQNCAERACCKYCGALETMSHILIECNVPWRVALWTEAVDLLERRGILVNQVSFGHILALSVLEIPKRDSSSSPADVRITRIVLAELMYLTWVLRCEWTIGRVGATDRLFSVNEVLNRWYWRVNRRLRFDVLLVYRTKKRPMPLKDVVLATWRGLISCTGDEPEDWMSLSEVLVGRTGAAVRRGVG